MIVRGQPLSLWPDVIESGQLAIRSRFSDHNDMFEFLRRWFGSDQTEERPRSRPAAPPKRPKAARPGPDSDPALRPGQPETVSADDDVEEHVETVGPGKNVLVRNKYVREETGTYETLKIVDDSMVDSGEETGIDPYNTGDFDRSKNWDKRFRK